MKVSRKIYDWYQQVFKGENDDEKELLLIAMEIFLFQQNNPVSMFLHLIVVAGQEFILVVKYIPCWVN